jgi:Tfp pilus assembly protein PilV
MQLKNNKGVSLIESLISLVIIFFVVIGIMNMITYFGLDTRNRVMMECLISSVESAAAQCRAMQTPANQITCQGYTVNITVNGSCSPAQNTCNDVTIQGSVKNRTFNLNTIVCNLQ